MYRFQVRLSTRPCFILTPEGSKSLGFGLISWILSANSAGCLLKYKCVTFRTFKRNFSSLLQLFRKSSIRVLSFLRKNYICSSDCSRRVQLLLSVQYYFFAYHRRIVFVFRFFVTRCHELVKIVLNPELGSSGILWEHFWGERGMMPLKKYRHVTGQLKEKKSSNLEYLVRF